MGLVFEIVLAVSLVLSTVVNLYFTARWGGRITEIDEDAYKTFSRVGDELGAVLARVSFLEIVLADKTAEDEGIVEQAANDDDAWLTNSDVEVHVLDLNELKSVPAILGVDFAEITRDTPDSEMY